MHVRSEAGLLVRVVELMQGRSLAAERQSIHTFLFATAPIRLRKGTGADGEVGMMPVAAVAAVLVVVAVAEKGDADRLDSQPMVVGAEVTKSQSLAFRFEVCRFLPGRKTSVGSLGSSWGRSLGVVGSFCAVMLEAFVGLFLEALVTAHFRSPLVATFPFLDQRTISPLGALKEMESPRQGCPHSHFQHRFLLRVDHATRHHPPLLRGASQRRCLALSYLHQSVLVFCLNLIQRRYFHAVVLPAVLCSPPTAPTGFPVVIAPFPSGRTFPCVIVCLRD